MAIPGAHACCEGNDILTEIGRSAEAARRAARERAGQAAKLATDDIDKEPVIQGTTEIVRHELVKLAGRTPTLKGVCRCLAASASSIAACIDWFYSDEEKAQFAKDCADYPEGNEALQKSFKRLLAKLGPSIGVDAVRGALGKLGSLSEGSSQACLRWMGKVVANPAAKAILAGFIVATLAMLLFSGKWQAFGNISAMSVVSATIVEGLAAAAGMAIAACGGPAWIMGIIVGWVVSCGGQMLRVHVTKRLSERDWWDAWLRALGLRKGPIEPQWSIPDDYESMIKERADVLICPINLTLMVQPANLKGFFFERKAIERWIEERHTHPHLPEEAYKYELEPAPEIRALVLRVKALYNLEIAVEEPVEVPVELPVELPVSF